MLFINDGSPDNSGKICEDYAYKDCRIKVFHQKNKGVSSARNIGIDNSIGKWVTFIDADDEFTVNCLEKCVNLLKNNLVDLIEYGCCILNKDMKNILFKYEESDTIPIYDFWNTNYKNFAVWGHLFKLEHLNKYNIRFDENLIMSEDRIFIFKYLCQTKYISSTSVCGYLYRQHEDSVCHTNITLSKVNSQIEAIKILVNYYQVLHKIENRDEIFTFLMDQIIRNYIVFVAMFHEKEYIAIASNEIFKVKLMSDKLNIKIKTLNYLTFNKNIFNLHIKYIILKMRLKQYLQTIFH